MRNCLFKEANHKFTLPSDEAAAIKQSHKDLMWPLCRETAMLCVLKKREKKNKERKERLSKIQRKRNKKERWWWWCILLWQQWTRANQLTYTIISFICSAHLLRNSFMGRKGPQRVKTYLITLLHKWEKKEKKRKESTLLQHAKLGFSPC